MVATAERLGQTVQSKTIPVVEYAPSETTNSSNTYVALFESSSCDQEQLTTTLLTGNMMMLNSQGYPTRLREGNPTEDYRTISQISLVRRAELSLSNRPRENEVFVKDIPYGIVRDHIVGCLTPWDVTPLNSLYDYSVTIEKPIDSRPHELVLGDYDFYELFDKKEQRGTWIENPPNVTPHMEFIPTEEDNLFTVSNSLIDLLSHVRAHGELYLNLHISNDTVLDLFEIEDTFLHYGLLARGLSVASKKDGKHSWIEADLIKLPS